MARPAVGSSCARALSAPVERPFRRRGGRLRRQCGQAPRGPPRGHPRTPRALAAEIHGFRMEADRFSRHEPVGGKTEDAPSLLKASGDLNVRDDPRGRRPRARPARRLNDGRPSRNAERSAACSADGSLGKPDLSRSVPRDRNYGSVFMKKHFAPLHSSSNGHASCVSCLGSSAACATSVLAWFETRSAPCPGPPVTGIHQMNFHTASSDAQCIFRMSKKPRRG